MEQCKLYRPFCIPSLVRYAFLMALHPRLGENSPARLACRGGEMVLSQG